MNFKLRNQKKGTIGQILTSFPALILVFVIMVVFVLISSFVSKEHSENYNMMDDFLDDWIVLNGEIIRVNEGIEKLCINNSLETELKINLREHFIESYGDGNAFALASRVYTNAEGGRVYLLNSWYGAFSEDFEEDKPRVSRFDFEEFFDLGNSNVFHKDSSCNAQISLWVKSGGEL